MSAGGTVSKDWSPKIASQGCVVIDNSSAWRLDPDVPLIVPEVNADAIDGFKAEYHRQSELLDRPARRRAEAAPRSGEDQACCRRHLSVRLRRRQGRYGRAVQPDQGGLRAEPATPKKFTKQIAFNVIPHIDVFMDDGFTEEEWKMMAETKKIIDPNIKLTATCVRVPVFIGHSEAVNIEFERPITPEEARRHSARRARMRGDGPASAMAATPRRSTVPARTTQSIGVASQPSRRLSSAGTRAPRAGCRAPPRARSAARTRC